MQFQRPERCYDSWIICNQSLFAEMSILLKTLGCSLFFCLTPFAISLQVQKVFQFHRELSGEELHTAPANRAAAEAPIHPGPAQRAASPYPAQRPHRPDQEEEGREGCVDLRGFTCLLVALFWSLLLFGME